MLGRFRSTDRGAPFCVSKSMPGSQHGPSIKNPRVYEALRRRRGMSKSRAAAISNAMVSKASGTADLAIPPTGPHALFNQPGVGVRSTRRRRLKGWNARVGEVIQGNLVRGEGGRFSGSGQPSARQTNSAAQRERAAARKAARQARADERAAAREAETAEEEATRAEEDEYIAAGATGRERQRRRAEIAAKRRQRATERRNRHRAEDAAERETRRQEDEQEAKTRADEQAKAEQAKGGKGGGGGGGKAKPTDEEKQAEQAKKRAANRAATAPQAGLSAEEAEFLAGAASGTLPPGSFNANKLHSFGLVIDTGDTTEATDAGRRALAALERGDVRGALAAIQDGKAKLARDQARAEAQRKREEERRKRNARKIPDAGRRKPEKKPAPNRGPLPPRTPPSTLPNLGAERERSQDLAKRIIRNLEERRQRRHSGSRGIGGITNVERRNAENRRRVATKAKGAKRERSEDENKAMFAAMSGGGKGGGQGRGGGSGSSGGGGKAPTLWEKNPETGKREASQGLAHENLFGASYNARQREVQARADARERARAADQKTREQFFALQTGTVPPTAPAPKITPAKVAPATSSPAHGLSKSERHAELEALTDRVKLPQPGWNAQASDKQRGYLGSLLDRARLNTKEGGEMRALCDAVISANKAGKLTKWEASQLIDAMQKPKPFSTLRDAALASGGGGQMDAPWRALLAIPGFRTGLISSILNREADAEGLPF